jgi:hypothetical protein
VCTFAKTRAFNFRRFVYRIKIKALGWIDNYSAFQMLMKSTQLSIFLALVFSYLLHLVDPIVSSNFDLLGMKTLENDGYISFLGTVAAVSGVFIGLYFAAISTIAGSIYANVPSNIRQLLAHERVGNTYMLFLSFVAFLCLILIGMNVLGKPRLEVAIPIMVLFSGIGIAAFVNLGTRAFNLFDPVGLHPSVINLIGKEAKSASAEGFGWLDKNFQNHARNNALFQINTLLTMSEIVKSGQSTRSDSFINLAKNVLFYLATYEKTKARIPTNSLWHRRRYEHPDWYLTQDSAVSLAHQSGTTVQPKTVFDTEWLEEELLPIICDCITANIERGMHQNAVDVLEVVSNYLHVIALSGSVARAVHVLKTISEPVLDSLEEVSKGKKAGSGPSLERLAIIECVASMPVTIQLAARQYLEKSEPSSIEKMLSSIDWRSSKAVFSSGIPFHLLSCMEFLKKRVDFEIQADGSVVTPVWYLKAHLLKEESKNFVSIANSISVDLVDLYRSWKTREGFKTEPWFVSAIQSTELEFLSKLDWHINSWGEIWLSLTEKRELSGLNWDDFDIDLKVEQVKNYRLALIHEIAEQSGKLNREMRSSDFPDYRGQFLHLMAEATFDALLDNDVDHLEAVYKPLFDGSLVLLNRLLPTEVVIDHRYRQAIKVAAAPIVDLLELSGYALLLSDYHRDDGLWRVVKGVWDNYLDAVDGDRTVKMLLILFSASSEAMEIAHRSGVRYGWLSRVGREFESIKRSHRVEKGSFGYDESIVHPSPIVRVYANGRGLSSFNGTELFILKFLSGHVADPDFDLGWKTLNLQRSLDHASQEADD